MSSLNVSQLDFETIKQSLKDYLKGNSRFVDYDFDGSNISVLLDIMAYNTHINAFYNNMMYSEMFIDTAQLRDSVVSHAKELNYVPISRRSSTAYIDVTVVPNDTPNAVTIPKATEFQSSVDGKVFTFTTADSVVMTDNGDGTFTAFDLPIYEGKYIEQSFTSNSNDPDQKFIIDDNRIDTSSLTVTVVDSGTGVVSTWLQSNTLLGLDGGSEVYFLQPESGGKYQIVFGNDIASKSISNGDIVTANFRISRTNQGVGASTFLPAGEIAGYSDVTVVTKSPASGGSEREDKESIRFNAPRYYQTRERAITTADYEVILRQEFTDIQAISVYGGEELSPPQFGRVAISIDLENADGVPDITKRSIVSFLKEKAPISITPIIIDPEFIFFELTADIKYNVNITSKSTADIVAAAVSDIVAYNEQEINNFNSIMKYSRLNAVIDNSDSSVVSSELSIRPFVKIAPELENTKLTQTYSFENELVQGIALTKDSDYSKYVPTVSSSVFVSSGLDVFLEDNGVGVLQVVTSDLATSERSVVNGKAGTVDYATGVVTLSDVQIDSYSGDGIKLYVRHKTNDFIGKYNKIIRVNTPQMNITAIPIRE